MPWPTMPPTPVRRTAPVARRGWIAATAWVAVSAGFTVVLAIVLLFLNSPEGDAAEGFGEGGTRRERPPPSLRTVSLGVDSRQGDFPRSGRRPSRAAGKAAGRPEVARLDPVGALPGKQGRGLHRIDRTRAGATAPRDRVGSAQSPLLMSINRRAGDRGYSRTTPVRLARRLGGSATGSGGGLPRPISAGSSFLCA